MLERKRKMANKIVIKPVKNVKDLRLVWTNEATDFTPWLADNIDILGNELGLSLETIETESSVGDFSLDILAQDSNTENYAVIENQLEETNHDHLGKLLTYAAGKNAKHIIWVVKKAREEHASAIAWLNRNTYDDIGFFLVELHLCRIDGSTLGYQFRVIQHPNGWEKSIKRAGRNSGIATQQTKYDFWAEFKGCAFANPVFAGEFKEHAAAAARVYSLGMGCSDACIYLTVNTTKNIVGVELHVPDNKALYDELLSSKADIEAVVGEELDWDRCDENKASRIRLEHNSNLQDSQKKKESFDWLVKYALLFKKAFAELAAEKA